MKICKAKRILCLCAVLSFTLFSCVAGYSQTTASEEQIKAAFVYRFTQYTKWPEPLDQTVYLCVYGDGPLAEIITSYSGRSVQGKSLQILPHRYDLKPDNRCNAVFINTDSRRILRDVIRESIKGSILLISDFPGALKENIDIALSTEPNRISFSINLSQARIRQFSFSGQMLKLAHRIL